ncbi:MAG: DegT/DnrJ/EryC1/StrS family aminotransferase [Firmicutes bacterium]|nr:DegT/DnrJ/EryC1/StrS family aminotransferase [Bacillota bacterium]
MITIAKPTFDEKEIQAIQQVLDSGMLASGAITEEFQNHFARYIGVQYGVATSSGTTALEILLRAIGIGKGDKVITTPFSFIASTNCIVYVGGTPIFADIDPTTFNITPENVEQKLIENPDTKAILIVHLLGHPCDMDAFVALAKKYKVLLLEDSAQAHGATYKNKKAGSFGTAAAFSFYPTKNMTTSEGGIIVTDNQAIAEKAKLLINHGMQIRYYHNEIGYNYRMTNISAAIGLCQLEKLDKFNERRIQIAQYYDKNIQNPIITLPTVLPNVKHCYHQYCLLIHDGKRDAFVDHLTKNNIGHGIHYPITIPEQKCYEHFNFDTNFPIANQIKSQIVSIPVHPALTDDEIKTVAQVVNEFV